MLAEMDSCHWQQWQEHMELEPAGGRREDFRAGVIASMIFNMLKAEGPAARPEDLFPHLKAEAEAYGGAAEPEPEQTLDEMLAIAQAFAAMRPPQGLQKPQGAE